MSHKSERMVVISFDLCRYSEITAVETATAAGAQNPVVRTNADIHKSIVEPLKEFARGNPGLRFFIKSTGDGALVFFPAEKAPIAIDYIVNFQFRAEEKNRKNIRDEEKYGINPKEDRLFRFYRIGCAVGRISIYIVSKHSGADFAGLAIADSVRIESTGRAGEILISEEVYSLLDKTRKMEFGRKRRIMGKHSSEIYMVRSIPPGLTAPWEIRAVETNKMKTLFNWSAYALIPLLIYGFKMPIAHFLLALP